MLGNISRSDLDTLLAASGLSVQDVLDNAARDSEQTIMASTTNIDREKANIVAAQQNIAVQTKELKAAQKLGKLVKTLGG